MLLSVDDFGCVPDGRYLSHVSIQAGSAQLSAPGGALRQADVSKHIAIPGAVDLVATVSGAGPQGAPQVRDVSKVIERDDARTRRCGGERPQPGRRPSGPGC